MLWAFLAFILFLLAFAFAGAILGVRHLKRCKTLPDLWRNKGYHDIYYGLCLIGVGVATILGIILAVTGG